MAENRPDHRPLAGADLETWAALATVLEWLPPALDADLVRDFELTHFEYGILYALGAAPDRAVRMSTLADFANSSLSRLSRAVSRLEARGWVRRSPDPADGRSTLAALTDDGGAILTAATPAHEAAVRRLVLDPLTGAQRRQLKEIALRMQRAVRERAGWRA
ncbi:MarR family transcriptional regulator [Rathayibacter sp. VKM Ac-2803]|uniref:MarR family winged helix-turn-helix transcriptional regulator n=1 Tax=unclassified Rathayibacter TaxID=2609250 RepID=UPI00135CD770|nr:MULTISPECIES: MarR family transcriptional regulator [unclassified Rathayibacter]MWV48525.1 MarR family transcriptional regulator [Rathayibacter sp. VKM Ac-2803]MWV60137.1 MarR family transcriptional regulator [Rathayibacter sp. VKM Ac-2754]